MSGDIFARHNWEVMGRGCYWHPRVEAGDTTNAGVHETAPSSRELPGPEQQ